MPFNIECTINIAVFHLTIIVLYYTGPPMTSTLEM